MTLPPTRTQGPDKVRASEPATLASGHALESQVTRGAGLRVILIHPDAPPKPALGARCNGCGVCCLAEPCPVGVIFSRRLRGACVKLQWEAASQRYMCGLMTGAAWRRRLVSRWIAAGKGCDAALEPQCSAAISSEDD